MLSPEQRALLYNENVDAADAVLLMVGGEPIEEAFNKGDPLIVTRDGILQDWESGESVAAGDYVVSDVVSGYIYIVAHNREKKTTGGKEYAVSNKAMEAAVAGNEVRFDENVEETGRKAGSVKGHPAQIRAMFKKGHLRKGKSQKTGKPTGKLEYRKDAFPRHQSGQTNPWYQKIHRQKPQQQQRPQPDRAEMDRSASGQRG